MVLQLTGGIVEDISLGGWGDNELIWSMLNLKCHWTSQWGGGGPCRIKREVGLEWNSGKWNTKILMSKGHMEKEKPTKEIQSGGAGRTDWTWTLGAKWVECFSRDEQTSGSKARQMSSTMRRQDCASIPVNLRETPTVVWWVEALLLPGRGVDVS